MTQVFRGFPQIFQAHDFSYDCLLTHAFLFVIRLLHWTTNFDWRYASEVIVAIFFNFESLSTNVTMKTQNWLRFLRNPQTFITYLRNMYIRHVTIKVRFYLRLRLPVAGARNGVCMR